MTKCSSSLLFLLFLLGPWQFLVEDNLVYGLLPSGKCDPRHYLSSLEDASRRGFVQQGMSFLLGGASTLLVAVPAASAVAPETAAVQESSSSSPSTQEEVKLRDERGGRPFAPREALLPATRCKVWIDHAYDISKTLIVGTGTTSTIDRTKQYETLLQLNQTLANRPKLFQSEKKQLLSPTTPSSSRGGGVMAQLTTPTSIANKEQFQRNRADLSLPDQLAAIFNQADVERQWGMIKYNEAQREQANEIRAAFNFYTSQLTFADFYVLTASPEDKKRLVRNDELPSLTAVIASDLDLRDLYRNELLTVLEDVTAEVSYQLGRGESDLDTTDVIELMDQSHTACTKWFDLIAPIDQQDALKIVLNEKEK